MLPLELPAVALAIGASFLSTTLLPLAVAAAGLFWLARWLAQGRPSRRTPVDGGVLLLLLMVPVTLWATALPAITRVQVLRLLSGIGLFYASVNWTDAPGRLRWLAAGLVAANLGIGLLAPIGVEWIVTKFNFLPQGLYDRLPPLLADAAHPNVMAGTLVVLLPLALGLLLFAWSELGRPVQALVLATGLLVPAIIFLTQSRGGLLALASVFLVLAALRWRRGWVLSALALLAAILVFSLVDPTQVTEYVSTDSAFTTVEGRVEIWSRAIYMIQDFPFTGIGMGSYTQVADALYPFFLAEPGQIDHAHNLFLQIAVDLGLPGLVAWLSIWLLTITFAWQLVRRGRSTGSGFLAGLGAGLLASQVALGVHGLVDAVTWGQVRPAPLVWGLWGLTFAGWNVLHRGDNPAP